MGMGMMMRYLRQFCIIAGALPIVLLLVCGAQAFAADDFVFKEAASGPASLKLVQGIPVVHVYGTPSEMGEQQGVLLGPQIKLLIRDYLNKLLLPGGRDIGLRRAVLMISRQMEKSIPKQYIEEMQALAKSGGVSYEDVLLANTFFDIRRAVLCSTIVAVGERSSDKQPIFGRNLDFPSLGVLHKYTCVVVYHPADGHAVASVTFPGFIGVLSGLNDAGVVAAVMEVHERGTQWAAVPSAMVFRTALTGAERAEDMLDAVKGQARTAMNNLMICDARGTAVCAELSVKGVAVRTPQEGVIHATNHFRANDDSDGWYCWRRARTEKELKSGRKLDEALVRTILADIAYERLTIQSMIFRPASREFLLAAGEPPAAKLKFVPFRKVDLFPENAKKKLDADGR